MMTELQKSPTHRMMWLTCCANYLFSTHGVRWAVDPLLPSHLLKDLPNDLITDALRQLSFLLLTHGHGDHVDYSLLASLRDTPVRFIIPEHMIADVQEHARLEVQQIIVARPNELLALDGIEVLPFAGLHWESRQDGRIDGIDAVGYAVQVRDQRWLFPGDVRDYRVEALRKYRPVEILFAHLWLGRGCALEANPPLLDAFCRFSLSCEPKVIVLTHLYDYARSPEHIWTHRHVDLVRARLAVLAPDVKLLIPEIGEGIAL